MNIDIKKLKQLARLVNDEGLQSLEISEGENKIRLEKAVPQSHTATECPVRQVYLPESGYFVRQTTPGGAGQIYENSTESTTDSEAAGKRPDSSESAGVYEVRSPIVGVLYLAPAPGKPPYVKKGSRVKAGDVLCIVEAMKLMNEITAERDGEIVEVCACNGDIVEYGRLLFKIK